MNVWLTPSGEAAILISDKEKTEEFASWKIIAIDNSFAVLPFFLSKKRIGTFLVDFLATDFTTLSSFLDFTGTYGLSYLVKLSETVKSIYKDKDIEGEYIQTFDKIYRIRSKDSYDQIMERIYRESEWELKTVQDIFKLAIYRCLDVNGPEWTNGLTVMQRFFVMENSAPTIDFAKEVRDEGRHISTDFIAISDTRGLYDFPIGITLPMDEYARIIKDDKVYLIDQYNSGSPGGICFVSFKILLQYGQVIRKCGHCDQYFMPTKRTDEGYCDRIADVNKQKTCKEIGPMVTYTNKPDKDPLIEEYRKAYKAKHAKMKLRGNKMLTKEEFYRWKEEAGIKMEEVRQGKITPEDFKTWCKK